MGDVSLVVSVVSMRMAGWLGLACVLLESVLALVTYVSAFHGLQLGRFERLNEKLVKKLEMILVICIFSKIGLRF